jgi:hypothetical protein
MNIEDLIKLEPWRTGLGIPKSALDPAWSVDDHEGTCGGNIVLENDSSWWWCSTCGYCAKGNLHEHYPAQDPESYQRVQEQKFVDQRIKEGLTELQARDQIAWVAAVAINYARTVKPLDLGTYIKQLKIK